MEMISSLDNGINSEVRNMLKNLYDIFLKKFHEPQNTWDHLLEFIAIDNSTELIFEIGHNLKWLLDDKRFRDSVLSLYDSTLLRSEYYDYLGEFYYELINKKPFRQSLSEKIQTQIKIKCKEKNDFRILDLNMSTGRNLLAISKSNPKAILFGVTNDLNLFRIALTNSLLFGIKCYLLHADITKHELGLNNIRGLTNWKHANTWSHSIDKLIQNLN